MLGISAALALDHMHDHIRVNVVVPGGGVVTGMTEGRIMMGGGAAQTVQGRHTLPMDIANAVSFLLSDGADMISGAVLTVGCLDGQGGPIPTRRTGEATAAR